MEADLSIKSNGNTLLKAGLSIKSNGSWPVMEAGLY